MSNNPSHPDDSDIDRTFRRLKRAPFQTINNGNLGFPGNRKNMLKIISDAGWTEEEYIKERDKRWERGDYAK